MIEMRLFLLAAYLVAMATGQQDPCAKYVSITDERRSIRYRAPAKEPNICDNNIDENVWYRFQTLPPQRIHDRCVEELKCGTEQPVWFSGVHPTAADPGPKEVDVCSPQGNDCCGGWRSKIQVKYCPAAATGDDEFYVYRLKRLPRCDMAYCSGDGDICARGTTWNPNSKTCTQPYPALSDPVFEGPTVVKRVQLRTETYDDFYFSCNIKWTDPNEVIKKGEQFEVFFTFNGQEVASVPSRKVDGSNLNVRLWSKDIQGHVGKTIGCKVRSYWKMLEGRRSEYRVASGTYFVGIRYSTTKAGPFNSPAIIVDEGSPALTLYFQATVPISCPETMLQTLCKFSVTMADISEKDGLGVLECSITFSGLDSDKQQQPAQIIKAQATPGINNRVSVLRFRPVSTNPQFFWHQFQMPDISIKIKDKSTAGVCSSLGDPHIKTFDGRYYHVYTEGDYLLAKSTKRHFEVHVRHHKCGPTATCNCAVAVREGNNVLGINFCTGPNTKPTTMTYLKDNNVPGATITFTGNSYTITMPSGAYLRADYAFWYTSYLSIYLHLNSEDYGQTSGLCGIWNGNPRDDCIPKGTATNDARDWPNTFSNSYRVRPDESFINGHARPINCLNTTDLLPNICTCKDRQAVTCSPPDPKTTTYVSQFAENCNNNINPNRPNPNPSRRRRDANSSNEIAVEERRMSDMMLTEADMPIPSVDETHGVNPTLRWPTPSGITEAQADRHCRSKMEGSPVYQMCTQRMSNNTESIVDSCIADAQAMDNLTVASAFIVSDFQRICVHMLEISVVTNEESSVPSPEEILMNDVMSMICPNQCNGNGNCQNGTCVCNSGFAGDDCSKNPRLPPQLRSFRKDIKCDFRSFYCHEASIFASNFFHSEKFKCRITAVDRSKNFTLSGFLVSDGEVVCKLPAVYRFTNEAADVQGPAAEVGPAPFHRWDIALTNDGNLYSNSLRLTVYDSKCQEFRTDGTIIHKADTCVIDGRCYRSGEASSRNRCNKCFPSKSRVSWTHDETEVCPSSATAVGYSMSIFAAVILIFLFRIDA